MIATALSLAGRHALAIYDADQFRWPEDYERLTQAMTGQIEMALSGTVEPTKKAKAAGEDEPVTLTVGLTPNYNVGENILGSRKDLKQLYSDLIAGGIEFAYAPSDIGWQWALDRANWTTIANKDLTRRIKVKASFTEGAVGIEMGAGGTKKRASKAKAAEPTPEPEPEPEAAEA